jgi:hypothetical protein
MIEYPFWYLETSPGNQDTFNTEPLDKKEDVQMSHVKTMLNFGQD